MIVGIEDSVTDNGVDEDRLGLIQAESKDDEGSDAELELNGLR